MKYAKLASLLLPLVFPGAGSALAGDTTVYSEHTTTVRVHEHHQPFVYVGRAVESFLHWPRLLSEGIEGDRALFNRRGFLGTKEVPVEDCIISPADGVLVVR
ncbi:hypothetical protein CfE428DRAFT_4306 [Chthoniobacter flavus Ellin428]|uniref:Uncharacterized protein n=1 Tax=Chthoniobacter flavus Ellin428 TaxID=497964 RepID=B4D5W7_9BACT|nr:hypothetical protein [Chthoniobacter flavus]EDY18170.1 hypothetical protein CfE428DRAFT_4306 [Chthoniobacter flavus Ellin428]TCO91476.1 hypothetical protein EV701_108204 [Chthoniobacter flavus]